MTDADLPDEEEAFGRPDADEAFPVPTAREQRAQVHATLGGSPMQDFIFGDADLPGSAANHFRPLFNAARETLKAFKESYGTEPLVPSEDEIHGLSESTTAFLKKNGLVKDYADGQKEVTEAADDAFLKPAATEKAIESGIRGFVSSPAYQAGAAGIRGFNAAWAAAQRGVYSAGQEYGFPRLAADLASFPDSTMGSPHPTGTPHPPGLPEHPPLTAAELENAKSLGVLASEDAWKNGATAEGVRAATEPGAPPPTGTSLPEILVTAGEEPPAAPAGDVHAAAREIAPEAIKEFDELSKRRDTFRKWVEDPEGKPPPNLEGSLKETEARLKELEPEVTAAYDAARQKVPSAASLEEAGEPRLEGSAEVAPPEGREPAADEPAAARPAEDQRDYIVQDVKRQMKAAGRPEDEAAATAQLVAARYEARASRMGGALGTSEELYDKEAAQIRGQQIARKVTSPTAARALDNFQERMAQGRDAAKRRRDEGGGSGKFVTTEQKYAGTTEEEWKAWQNAQEDAIEALEPEEREAARHDMGSLLTEDDLRFLAEQAEKGEFFQSAQGKINLNPKGVEGRDFIGVEGQHPILTLMKKANASTAVHELGHEWLAQMLRDAEHEKAPADLLADRDAVLKWFGIDKVADIATTHHEKFARGFEQYLREGIAPSKELASVFAKFKAWLTKIYETLKGLGSPINDDIRRVFDRMLTRPDDAVIAAERPGMETFADRHEAAVDTTNPGRAHDTAVTIQSESDSVAALHLPTDLQDARFADVEEEAGRREAGGQELDRHGNEPEAPAGAGGVAAEPGAVEAGRGEAAASGATARPAAGPTVKTKPPASATERFEDDKAGNIVLPNLNTSEEVADVIRKTASENNNFQEVRGPIPDSEVMALAEAMGMDAAYLDTRKIGEAWTAPQIVALRQLLIKSAAAVRDAMIKAATGNPEALMEYAEAKARHVMIQKTVSSVTAEAGRALRAFQGRFTEGMAEANQIGAFLKNATGKTLFQLQREAKFGAGLQTPQQLALFIDSTEKKGFANAVIEYYVNALISGPVTHMRYMVGNQVKLLATPLFEIPVGAAVGKFRELTGAGPAADRIYLGEVAPALYGIMKGSRDGMWKAWDAFQTGVSEPLPGEKISPHFMTPGGAVPGPVGTVLRTPGRAVSAIHTFYKMATYEMGIQRLAYRAAMNEGLEGGAFTNRVTELTTRPTSTMMTAATAGALKELFMAPTDYNSVSGQLTRAFNNPSPAGVALKVIAPFMKIGMQITGQAFVERTPIGVLASKEVRKNLSFKGGEMGQGAGAAFDEQMAKQITGIALVGSGVGLTLEGIMTGDGPEDPDKRAVWLLSHRPNSIQIGDINLPYQGLGALGMLLRFSANMTHTAQGWNEEEGATLAMHFFQGFTKSVLDENFMRGFKDMLDAIYHPQEYGPNYVKQFATNWLPFSVGMSQTARMVDPYQREAKTIWQTAQAKVPWLSTQLMPRRDIFGEPMPNNAAEATARYADDPVVKAMGDLQIGVGKLDRDIRGVRLTDEQYDELSMKAGRMAKMRLDRIVEMPGFSRMAPEIRIELMHKAISQSRETARKLIMIQNPEIVRAATDNKVGKKIGTVPLNQKPTQVAR